MVGLGFSGALRGFERRLWSVTLLKKKIPCVGLSYVFLSFFVSFLFCLMSSDAKEHNY